MSIICCKFLVIVYYFMCIHLCGINSQDFGYDEDDGPNHWGEKFAQCLGKHQSPIDIETHKVVTKNFPPLKYQHFDDKMHKVELQNNGHTVEMKLLHGHKPKLHGGPLMDTYEFLQLHFHWGPNNSLGSENLINHISFPLEMHIVFYNTRYNSSTAPQKPGGLTVLSFLIKLSDTDNKNYDLFEEGLSEIREVSANKTIHNFGTLDDLIFINERERYFTYEGSLTTPPCSEVVTWIEYINTIPLSKEQINSFRMVTTKHGLLTHNFRPIQPLNGRTIYYNNTNISRLNFSLLVLTLIFYFIRSCLCKM